MVFYILFVWYEISVDLFGNAVLTLLRHREHLDRLTAEPDLIPTALEELWRYEAPMTFASPRYPLRDIDIAGTTIRAGDTVLLSVASANRDPRRFPEPDSLVLDRADNPHLSLGLGIHTCLGAPLVRREYQIALAALLRRFPNLSLAVPAERLRWRPGLRHRGLVTLPVTA
ncbi:MAG: cytochrome P450 [Actinobacteria bacterium]|nr:cytochrome P450 [Actinomycetota bacterium]MBI3686629.1 cytochrome P450 [Actinomycetota bacterium]